MKKESALGRAIHSFSQIIRRFKSNHFMNIILLDIPNIILIKTVYRLQATPLHLYNMYIILLYITRGLSRFIT